MSVYRITFEVRHDSIFSYVRDHHILINPTNQYKVMGAGLAKQFKEKFPYMWNTFTQLPPVDSVDGRILNDGDIHVTAMWPNAPEGSAKIVCLPTKRYWRNASDASLIRSNLETLRAYLLEYDKTDGPVKYHTLVIPPIGCGLGGIHPDSVLQLIQEVFSAYLLFNHPWKILLLNFDNFLVGQHFPTAIGATKFHYDDEDDDDDDDYDGDASVPYSSYKAY